MWGSGPSKGMGPNPLFGQFQFGPNGAANPVISGASTTLTGGAARWVTSITYSATGVYTIVFNEGFGSGSGLRFFAAAHPADLTNWFEIVQTGAYNSTTRTLVLQAHRAGTANAPAAGAAVRVNVLIVTNDSTAP